MASVQVGAFCYADMAAAGAAACSAHIPTTTVAGSSLVSVSCGGVDAVGALQMRTAVSPLDGSSPAVVSTVLVSPAYGPCLQGDLVNAGIAVLLSLLVAWVAVHGVQRVIAMLRWGRGEQS